MKKRRVPQPNYLKKLRYLWKIGAIPREVGLHMIEVRHDSWCDFYRERPCDCDPTIRLKASVPGSMN